jgi:AcrR family transcriptional regulator
MTGQYNASPGAAETVAVRAGTRFAARRNEILMAAGEVLTAGGADAFTLAAVAKRVGMNPVSLTYYFHDRTDLANAVLEGALARYRQMLAQAQQGATSADRLRTFVGAYFAERRTAALEGLHGLAALGHLHTLDGGLEEVHRLIVGLLVGGQAASAPLARARALAPLVANVLAGSEAWLNLHPPSAYERIGERLADLMINGLGASPAQWPAASSFVARDGDDGVFRRLLMAGTKLINQAGYRGASVDRVSAELGVTKGAFYHYVASKDDLFDACFARSADLIDQALAVGSLEDDDWSKLATATATLVSYQVAGDGDQLLGYGALAAAPPKSVQQHLARLLHASSAFADLTTDAIASGAIRPVDAALAGHYLLSICNSARPLVAERPAAADRADQLSQRLFLRPALSGFFVDDLIS